MPDSLIGEEIKLEDEQRIVWFITETGKVCIKGINHHFIELTIDDLQKMIGAMAQLGDGYIHKVKKDP
jgi:hypothetical protein